MMRHLVMTVAVLTIAADLGAFSGAPQTPSPTPSPKTLTLTGCISGDAAAPNRFTLTDAKEGTTYRLSGAAVRNYVGRRVLLTGGLESKRLHIVGGLVPSANVAGQAGDIDPARAATAGSATGAPAAQPTFRVTRVRALTGSCPER